LVLLLVRGDATAKSRLADDFHRKAEHHLTRLWLYIDRVATRGSLRGRRVVFARPKKSSSIMIVGQIREYSATVVNKNHVTLEWYH
jgi:hypothetical protein